MFFTFPLLGEPLVTMVCLLFGLSYLFFFLMSNILLASPVLAVTDLPADNEFGPVVSDT